MQITAELVHRVISELKRTPLGVIARSPGTLIDKRPDGFWVRGAGSPEKRVDVDVAAFNYVGVCAAAGIAIDVSFANA